MPDETLEERLMKIHGDQPCQVCNKPRYKEGSPICSYPHGMLPLEDLGGGWASWKSPTEQKPTPPKAEEPPFEWVRISSIDEMEAFFISKLPAIRAAAKACGYAIGQHGSMRRDMDLIAVPWMETAGTKDQLAAAIHKAACGLTDTTYRWTNKPLGRVATSMPICWMEIYAISNLGCIDLSVMDTRGHLLITGRRHGKKTLMELVEEAYALADKLEEGT